MENGKLRMDNFRMEMPGFSQMLGCLTTIVTMVRSQEEFELRIESRKMKENVVKDKSFDFALRVVKLAKFLEARKGNLFCLGKCFVVGRRSARWSERPSTPRAKRISFTR